MKQIKALLLNGSPKRAGVCGSTLNEVQKKLEAQGVEVTLLQIGDKPVRGCIACNYCKTHGKCVFNDVVNETAPLLQEADIVIAASPTYYAGANSTLLSYLTRLFYSTPFSKAMKVGAAITSARRAGTVAAFDEINRFFTISQMPVVSSRYWNNIFGNNKEEAATDLEGLAIARQLATNAAWLAKSIQLGKESFGDPDQEPEAWTNFSDPINPKEEVKEH